MAEPAIFTDRSAAGVMADVVVAVLFDGFGSIVCVLTMAVSTIELEVPAVGVTMIVTVAVAPATARRGWP